MQSSHRMSSVHAFIGCLTVILAAACGADTEKSAVTTQVVAAVRVPETFSGPATLMNVIGFHLPRDANAIMPDAVFAMNVMPITIDFETPYALSFSTTEVGSFQIVMFLYVEGGGTTRPVAGKDYVAQTAEAIDLRGGTVDLGTVMMALFDHELPLDG